MDFDQKRNLDKEIARISKNTRTTVSAMMPLHDLLRQKYSWYYKWHLNPWSSKVHTAILSLTILIFVAGISFSVFGMPASLKAFFDFAPGVNEKNIDYSKIYSSVPEGSKEITAKRTENQKVFQRPDGKEQYIISSSPMHYKDASGNWQDIDSSITQSSDGSFEMDKSIYAAKFAKDFIADKLVQISKDGQDLSMKPGGLSLTNGTDNQSISTPKDVQGESNGHEVSYKNAYGSGLDFGYETQDLQLNKTLVINSLASLPAPNIDMSNEANSFIKLQLGFNISPGMQIFIDDKPWDGSKTTIENQNLIFKKDGKTIWQLTPAKAWDQAGVDKAITGKTIISKDGNQLNLQVQFPYSWLKTAQYPVTIDPDTYYGETTNGIIEGYNNGSYATAHSTSTYISTGSDLQVGQYRTQGTKYHVYRSYLEFNTSGIGGSTVTQANLYLTATVDSSAQDFTLRIHKYNWTSPLAAGTQEADYDGALASTFDANWKNTADGDFATNTPFMSANLDTTWIQHGATKTQYALLSDRDVSATGPTGNEYVYLADQSNATQAYRPYLSITATGGGPATRYWICAAASTCNWNTTGSWSATSGGATGASVPTTGDTAVFDGASSNTGNVNIDTAVSVGTLDFQAGYTGTITQNANTITTATAMNLNGTNLTMGAAVTASGTLTIGSGKTLDLAGNALSVTGAFTDNGTIQLKGSETITGTPTLAAGSTVIYNDTAASARAIQNWSYQNLTISASGGSYKAPAADVTVGGNFALTAGTYNTSNSSDRNLTITGNATVAGTFTANSSAISVGGNWDSSSGTFTYNTSTVTITGSGSINSKSWLSVGANTFYNLIISGTTHSLTTHTAIAHQLTMNGSTSGAGDADLTGSGDVLVLNGGSIYRVLFEPSTSQNIPGSTTAYTYIQGWSYSGAAALNQTGDITCQSGGSITIASDNDPGIGTWDTGGHNITCPQMILGVAGANSNRYGVLQNSGAGASTVTLSTGLTIYAPKSSSKTGDNTITAGGGSYNTINLSIGGNWTNNDTFTAGTSTVTFNGTASQQIITSTATINNTFYNLTLNNGTNTNTLTLNPASGTPVLDVNGLLTITKGTLSPGAYNTTLAGGLTFSDTTNGILTRGAGTLTFDGTGTWTDSRTTEGDLGTITINGPNPTTLTLGSSVLATNITVSANNTLNLGAGSYTLTLSGTGTPLTVTGAFNKGTGSTVIYTGTTTATNITVVVYNNLTLTPTASTTYSLAGHLNAANSTAMTGNLTINNYATLTTTVSNYNIDCVNLTIASGGTLTANTSTFTISGNWDSSSGTFTYNTSTITLTGASPNINFGSYGVINNLNITTSGQTVTLANYAEVAGTLTLGTTSPSTDRAVLTSSSKSIYLLNTANPLVFNGSYQANAGSPGYKFDITAIFYVSANSVIPGGTYSQNFYAFAHGDNYTLTAQGDITVLVTTYIYNGTANKTSTFDLFGHAFSTYNLSIGNGTNTQWGKLKTSNGNVTVTDDMSILSASVAGSNVLDAGSSAISVAHNWTNNDTFTAGTSTVTFTAATGTQTLNSGGTAAANTFNNVTHSGAGTLQLSTNSIKMTGNFTNSGGTFDTNSLDMTIGGNINLTGGSLTQGTRTITLNGSGAQSFTAGGTGAGHTPYNLTITNSNVSGVTFLDSLTLASSGTFTDATGDSHLTFNAGSTYTIPTLNLSGTSGHLITLASSTTSAWTINPTVATVSYVTVSYSTNTGTHFCAAYSTNGGNNTTWSFSTGATCNDSITLSVDNNTLTFGNLLPGSVYTGTTITTVTTNYGNGYTLGVNDNVAGTNSALVHTDSVTYIADYAGTIATPTLWSGTGLGICVYSATNKNTSQWGTGTTESDSNNKYAGVPQNTTTINTKTGSPTTSDQAYIGYKLVVPNTQKTGNYAGAITYTATGVIY